MARWLEREFTGRKVRGSSPTAATRPPLPRIGQTDSISALVLPSGDMTGRHQKRATAEQFFRCASATEILGNLTCCTSRVLTNSKNFANIKVRCFCDLDRNMTLWGTSYSKAITKYQTFGCSQNHHIFISLPCHQKEELGQGYSQVAQAWTGEVDMRCSRSKHEPSGQQIPGLTIGQSCSPKT
ncbi:hypothetical protein T265_00083 [Opisthorchis viverrini]|uniref:Uncharacterized protein n=1 Tax=Opisthorchis viverrini TaxID=6198 RepID=A0A075ADI2_OPIVI|nr:hypothetical protein T265_00083 [Opisthorchis viverrini]KER34225.1 hypothetical protein T265_00083 [Opisthorchis viverrini]